MRIYFLIIIYIVLIFQNYLYSNSLLEENDYNQIIETIEEQKEIEEIQNSNIPEKPNIFDKINNRESVRNMILNISLYLENGGDINVADNEGNTLLMKSV